MADSEKLRERIQELEKEVARLKNAQSLPYRAVVEDLSELVVRWKPDGTRTFVNDAYCKLFDASRDELIGSSFWPLISEHDREEVQKRITTISMETPFTIGRHRAIRPDGSEFWMEWVDRGIFDSDGKLIEMQSVGRDISDRIVFEEQARKLEFADAVSKTTAALAHDLNNLLQVVVAEFEFLVDELEDPQRMERLDTALDNIVTLVGRLSKPDYLHVQKAKPVYLNDRIMRMLSLMKEVAGPDILVKLNLCEEKAKILGDDTQMTQIVLNLVKNATEAMTQGGTINITTEVEEKPTTKSEYGTVILKVSDTGPGIPESILPKIFTPHVTTKPDGQGLGLATVKTIVESHQAEINIKTSSKGTEFELRFPLVNNNEYSMR